MRRFVLSLALAVSGCESFFAANEPGKKTVEGCAEAVDHLKQCCPSFSSFLSCSYFESASNANAAPDLSPGQSRCVIKKSCDAIERAVTSGGTLCDLPMRDSHCH